MFSFDQQFSQPLSNFNTTFAQQLQPSRYPLNSFGNWIPGSCASSAFYPSARYLGYPSNNTSFASNPQINGFPVLHQLPLGPSSASPFFKDHHHILRDLFQDRQRDLALDQHIKKLVDSARFSRRSDHTVRHIMQGRPIVGQEIVRDILADRVKDQAIAELVSLVLEERKYDRVLDQVLGHFQAGMPVPVGGSEELVKQQRQRYFDLQVAQAVQAVFMNDLAAQFGGIGMGGRSAQPWGYPTDPISSGLPSCDQRQFANVSAQFPCPAAATASCPPATQFMSGCPVSAPQPPLNSCFGPNLYGNPSTRANPVELEAAMAMMGTQQSQQLYGGCGMPDARSQMIADIAGKKFM